MHISNVIQRMQSSRINGSEKIIEVCDKITISYIDSLWSTHKIELDLDDAFALYNSGVKFKTTPERFASMCISCRNNGFPDSLPGIIIDQYQKTTFS